MRFRFPVFACLLSGALVMGGQAGRPIPPGIREADKLENREQVPPPVTGKGQPLNPAQLQRDAQELVRLAQLIPSGIQQVEEGKLPKDLDGQLRRIEKLAKQLRREVIR
jgi:hypothetical protein